MERRRRAFGLKNVGNKKEIQAPVASSSDISGSPKSSLKSPKTVTRSSKQCPPPEQCTPKRKVGREPSASPQPPILSPGFQPVFPRTLNSPEIEVSWDWGCSQATNDMLPPAKRPKRKCQQQISPLVEPAATYSRLSQSQEVTTKENEERLAFYKNILSKSFQKKSERGAVVENNNTQISNVPEANTTPQRPRRSSVGLNRSKELINDPFDDSANEFMFECSQAIEEKLKNGEIQVGPMVKINLVNQEISSQSPQNGKKVHLRKTIQNLFPSENAVNVQNNSQVKGIKSPQNKRNQVNSNFSSGISPGDKSDGSNESHYLTNNLHTVLTPKNKANENLPLENSRFKANTNSAIKTSSGCFSESNSVNKPNVSDRLCDLNSSNTQKRPHQMFPRECSRPNTVPNRRFDSSKYDSVDKFRRPAGSSMCPNKPNVPSVGNSKVVVNENKVPLQVANSSSRQAQERLESTKMPGAKGESSSITSLLDDDFDIELSSLDFDSLVQTDNRPTNKRQPEITLSQKCSKQEIEAKRLAALNRLMMKKKR